MPSDFESGTRKTVAIAVQAEKMTADLLKSALRELLNGNTNKKGKMSLNQLKKKAHGKLDDIEVSAENIGNFLDTARKYDVDFAIKADKTTSPPTYHVFFSASKTDDFKRAFTEYVSVTQSKTHKRGEITREQINKEAQRVASQPHKKHKEREKKRETRR